jgi:hypothetical protein
VLDFSSVAFEARFAPFDVFRRPPRPWPQAGDTPRNPQAPIGLIMVDGWPIAHHVSNGNWRDAKTVPEVLNDRP